MATEAQRVGKSVSLRQRFRDRMFSVGSLRCRKDTACLVAMYVRVMQQRDDLEPGRQRASKGLVRRLIGRRRWVFSCYTSPSSGSACAPLAHLPQTLSCGRFPGRHQKGGGTERKRARTRRSVSSVSCTAPPECLSRSLPVGPSHTEMRSQRG